MGKEGIGNVVSDIPGYLERLCRGRTGYEFIPKRKNALDLGALAGRLEACNIAVEANTPHLLIVKVKGTGVSVFASGKLIVKDVESKEGAEKIAAELIKIIAERRA